MVPVSQSVSRAARVRVSRQIYTTSIKASRKPAGFCRLRQVDSKPGVHLMYQDLSRILGPANVLNDPQILDSFSKDESFAQPLRPAFIVKPENAAQVQELVQWANRTLTPLVPVSSGPPHLRGGTGPSA